MVTLLMLCAIPSRSLAQSEASDIDRFSKDVTALTDDWMADPWYKGEVRLHPQIYNEVASDFYLKVSATENIDNRSAQSVLTGYYENAIIGDVDNELKTTMADAKIVEPGFLLKTRKWSSYFGSITSLWGVMTTHDNFYVAFDAKCTVAQNAGYSGEKCLENVLKIMISIQNGTLKMPQTEAPIYVPGWNGSYDDKGVSRLSRHTIIDMGGFGVAARSNWIYAAPPRTISPNDLRSAIIKFADDTKIYDYGDPDTASWNADVMIRTFPKSNEGPAYQFALAKKMPDGRQVILSALCYNKNWFPTCNRAMERVIGDVESGMMAMRVAERSKNIERVLGTLY